MSPQFLQQTTGPRDIRDELLVGFAAKARPSGPGASVHAVSGTGDQEKQTTMKWLEPTTKALNRLPWQETNLPDGRIPPKPEAAVGLLCWCSTSSMTAP